MDRYGIAHVKLSGIEEVTKYQLCIGLLNFKKLLAFYIGTLALSSFMEESCSKQIEGCCSIKVSFLVFCFPFCPPPSLHRLCFLFPHPSTANVSYSDTAIFLLFLVVGYILNIIFILQTETLLDR